MPCTLVREVLYYHARISNVQGIGCLLVGNLDVDVAKLPQPKLRNIAVGTVDHEQASGKFAVGRSGNEWQDNNLRCRRAEMIENGRASAHPYSLIFPHSWFCLLSFCLSCPQAVNFNVIYLLSRSKRQPGSYATTSASLCYHLPPA